MFAAIQPIHAIMEQGPHTIREIAFQQAYGKELRDASVLLARYKRLQAKKDFNAAWEIYTTIHGRIQETVPRTISFLSFYLFLAGTALF